MSITAWTPEYRATNADPDRLAMREREDCTVVALSHAADISYADAWCVLDDEGRVPRRGTYYQNLHRALLGFGREARLIPFESPLYRRARTVRTLERHIPKAGVFLAYTSRRSHVLCIRDGYVHDWSRGRLNRIAEVYEIVPFRLEHAA